MRHRGIELLRDQIYDGLVNASVAPDDAFLALERLADMANRTIATVPAYMPQDDPRWPELPL